MLKIQAHIIFKGRVQGVGFRFTVQRIALNLGITGWIKNFANGDVEVIAEADREIVDIFLNKIRDYFKRYIIDEEINTTETAGEFSDFEIRF
ncbi:acylphosphatase [bacterium]|nr:acylphosphatase [bacterium]